MAFQNSFLFLAWVSFNISNLLLNSVFKSWIVLYHFIQPYISIFFDITQTLIICLFKLFFFQIFLKLEFFLMKFGLLFKILISGVHLGNSYERTFVSDYWVWGGSIVLIFYNVCAFVIWPSMYSSYLGCVSNVRL